MEDFCQTQKGMFVCVHKLESEKIGYNRGDHDPGHEPSCTSHRCPQFFS